MLRDARAKGTGEQIKTFVKLSGPGWLQGAITLGGGSLSGALYLGVIMGYNMMWLQPLAMILGVIMLSAISYVTLSTGQRPFRAVNEHVSPILGWGWLIATLMANIVWCLPQFSLGSAAVTQNLIPALGASGTGGKFAVCIVLCVIAVAVIRFYDKGGNGLKVFEGILKAMVGLVVLSFFGVVAVMFFKGNLPLGEVFAGLIPNFSMLSSPAPLFEEALASLGEGADYWRGLIVSLQRDKMIAAFATAVGINMTFLLPYSMLKKGWGKEHRGLAVFDLSIGLIVPFVLATGCVVVASASQFHGKHSDIITETGQPVEQFAGAFNKVIDGRLKALNPSFGEMSAEEIQIARDALPLGEKQVAAMLVDRDAFHLAGSLKPLTGDFFAQVVFGVGVLGMAVSTIIILMLISGFTFCEMLNKPDSKRIHFIGCLIPAAVGIWAPFLWKGKALLALAIPTSVIGGSLLPIAYLTFLLLINSRRLLGDACPTGGKRIAINAAMLIALLVAGYGSIIGLLPKSLGTFPIGKVALGVLVLMAVLGTGSFFAKQRELPAKGNRSK